MKTIKDVLLWWGMNWYYQHRNGKFTAAPVMTTAVTILSLFMGISYGYDGANDIPVFTTTITKILAITWTVFLVGWVVNNWLYKIPLTATDKWWRTQLFRFKDPDFLYLKHKYPDWQGREIELENKWEAEYGQEYYEYEKTLIGKLYWCWFVVTAIIGIGIGSLI